MDNLESIIIGLEFRKQKLTEAINALQMYEQPAAPQRKHKKRSEATRKRMAASQQKRWAMARAHKAKVAKMPLKIVKVRTAKAGR